MIHMINIQSLFKLGIVLTTLSVQSYTLRLDNALDKALQHNLPLQQAKVTWLMNTTDKNIALSYLLPQMSLSQSHSKNRIIYPHASSQGTEISRSYQEKKGIISLSQELFNMQSYYVYSKANQKAVQDLLIYQNALQNLSLTVAEQYFQLIMAIENYRFLQTEAQETQQKLNDITKQVQYGAMTKSQLLEVQAQDQRVRANVLEAKQAIANTYDRLADSIGCHQFTHIATLGETANTIHLPIPALKHWLSDAMQNNISLKIAASELKQSQYLHKAARSSFLPTLSFNSSYSRYKYPSQTLKIDGGNALNMIEKNQNKAFEGGITLSYPLINGGKRYYDNQKYQEGLHLAKINLENNSQIIQRQIKQRYRKLKLGSEVISARQSALKSATEMLKLSQISLQEGAVTVLETLNNIANVREDQHKLEQTRYAYLLDLITLLIEAGVITPKDIQEIDKDFVKQQEIPLLNI